MNFVKKNLFILICATIAVLSGVSLWYPTQSKFDDLTELMTKRTAYVQRINGLIKQPRTRPQIDLTSDVPTPLGVFPRADVIRWGKEQTGALKEQAASVMKWANRLQWNRTFDNKEISGRTPRDLLFPGCLPDPKDPIPQQFRDAYDNVNRLYPPPPVAGQPAPPYVPPGTLAMRLAATQPVSADDKKAEEARVDAIADSKALLDAQGKVLNQSEVDAAKAEGRKGLEPRLLSARALQYKIYIDGGTGLFYNNTIDDAKVRHIAPSPKDIFWAQIQLWVQQDIVDAIISSTIDPAKPTDFNIESAVVKRIEVIDIDHEFLAGDSKGPSGPDYAKSPSGRVSNSLYDVMRFRIRVDVDANKMLKFVDELQKDHFITVLMLDVAAVDRDADAQLGYWYGSGPVVRLTMDCESLFFRSNTVELMPEAVKESLGLKKEERGR